MGCSCSKSVVVKEDDEPLIAVFRENPDLSNKNNSFVDQQKELSKKPTINAKEQLDINKLVKNMTFRKFQESKTIYINEINEEDIAENPTLQNGAELFERIKTIGKSKNVDIIKSTKTLYDYAYKKVDISDKNDETAEMILKEVDILKNLNHPNIIKLFEATISKDNKYIEVLTEFADDGDLQMKLDEYKDNNKHFEENQLVDWLSQICFALKYIHSENILHRNVKPSNIFLMKEGYAKLGDFGMAKCMNNNGDLKRVKTIIPKIEKYTAPEILENKDFTKKTDIWFLGVTFFELMNLSFPFKGENETEILSNILKDNKNEYNCSYDDKFKEIIDKMISKDPDKRPNAEEILDMSFIRSRMESYLEENEDKFIKAKNTLKLFDDCEEIETVNLSQDNNENEQKATIEENQEKKESQEKEEKKENQDKKEDQEKKGSEIKEIKIVEFKDKKKKNKAILFKPEDIIKYEQKREKKAAKDIFRQIITMKKLVKKLINSNNVS